MADDTSDVAKARFDSIRRHYVYTLAYPEGRVFYVGKGLSDRIDEHEEEARHGVQSPKCDIIRGIWRHGGAVIKRKRAFFAYEEEALAFEARLIATRPHLANEMPGELHMHVVAVAPDDQLYFGASIRRWDEQGIAYWSAREMANFLGYARWDPFNNLVARIERTAAKLHWETTTHFRHTTMAVEGGGGAIRMLEDVHLTREAFLLVLQNGDSNKAMVGYGKGYIVKRLAGISLRAMPQGTRLLIHSPSAKLRRLGGTPPEDLPPEPSIRPLLDQQARRRKQATDPAQPSLLDLPPDA